jgi:hypothetical protein
MFFSEPAFSASVKRFTADLAPHAKSLPLSARRDVFAKSFYGVAYSQAMARCRAQKLLPLLLCPMRIDEVVRAFRIDPLLLVNLLIGSADALATAERDLEDRFRQGNVRLCVLSPERDSPRSLHVFTLAMLALARTMGPDRPLQGRFTEQAGKALYLKMSAELRTVNRRLNTPYALSLRQSIATQNGIDCDAVVFSNISHEVIAREAAALVAKGRMCLMMASDEALFYQTIPRSTTRSGDASTENIVAELVGDSLRLRPLRLRFDPPTLYSCVPSRSASFLLDRWDCRDASVDPDDDLFQAAADLTRDELGRLGNVELARTSFRDALVAKEVPRDHAVALADRFVERVQS